MRKFKSLTRLLMFYALSLVIMLALYYVMMLSMLKTDSQHHSQMGFEILRDEITQNVTISDPEIRAMLDRSFFKDISYQIILMLPSGQSYIYRYTRPQEHKFTTIVFPSLAVLSDANNRAYQLTDHKLIGVIKLKDGHQVYVVLRHKPIDINWLSYQYWLPLMIVLFLLAIVMIYMAKRRLNWLQLLRYIENLTTTTKETYTLYPFDEKQPSSDFARLGHALGRVSYQLHTNYRSIKTLSHRLERLVDQAPLPMLMIMRQGQISFFNQRFEQVFATTFVRDTSYSLTDFVTGSDKTTQQLLQNLSLQRVTRTLLVYGLDNKQAYQLHITPWFGEHGQVHGFTALLSNVDNFIKQNEQLKSQQQQAQLQINEFAQLRSVIGHELRTPLSAIIGTLELIDNANFSVGQQDTLDTLKHSSNSMLVMLNDMLDMAKIEAGKTQIVSAATDIFKVSQHIVDLMAGSARQKNLDLLYIFMPECPRFIDTDAKRLEQIILNLMNNAIKFTASGYVALVIEPVTQQQMAQNNRPFATAQTHQNAPATIDEPVIAAKNKTLQRLNNDLAKGVPTKNDASSTDIAHQWIRFSIVDTGIGIVDTEQHKLFSYFNQANANISHKFGGTGLGLAISSSFAQLLGGFIQLDSDGHSGSTFALYLPCRAPTYHLPYHFNTGLTPIHLVAILKYDLCVNYMQRLCQHLSISADIYAIDAIPNVDKLIQNLHDKNENFAPLLIIDYEYETANTEATDKKAELTSNKLTEKSADREVNHEIPNYILARLLAMSLPKILMSMKPERSLSSLYLDQFDGFLNKPLDVILLLSEIIRLTQPKPITSSAPSVNSTVELQLSKTDEAVRAPTVQSKAHDNEQDAQQPLILVVEDNIINQRIVCKLLERLGYRAIVAQDGQLALQQLAATVQPISLILMDCRMPVMDGLETTCAIRAKGNFIPIIALTANDSVEDQAACYAAGMNEFLTKPINKDRLNEALQRLIPVSQQL